MFPEERTSFCRCSLFTFHSNCHEPGTNISFILRPLNEQLGQMESGSTERWSLTRPLVQMKSSCFCSARWILDGLFRRADASRRLQTRVSDRMRISGVLLIFFVTLCSAQKHKAECDHRTEAERLDGRGCANLMLVLDNWKYAIMTQVKDLLLHDHNTVLPDYGRIQPLSDALGDLYKEFNALKTRLAELTARFEDVEAFVDDVRWKPASPRGEPRLEGSLSGQGPAGRRSRVVIRRIKNPTDSQ